MTISCKSERSLVGFEEWEVVKLAHLPEIYALADKELQSSKTRLRELHSKTQMAARQKQREVPGKAEPRDKSFPGAVEQPQKRKQVFSQVHA